MSLEHKTAFLSDLADVFDLDASKLTHDFSFPKGDEWESVAMISTIALVDEHFNVTLRADDLTKMQTLTDLFSFVEQRG